VLDRSGPDARTLEQGLAAAQKSPGVLREALFGGKLPGAACRLLGPLAAAGLVEREAIVEGGRALAGDGDARERASARQLLGLLDAAPDEDPSGADWSRLAALGRRLLAPPLSPAEDEDDGSDWLDDLELDLLEDDAEDDLERALDQRVAELEPGTLLHSCVALAESPTFASRALGRLSGDDASAAGACLMLVTGRWSHQRLPGWNAALAGLVRSAERPPALRSLACQALAAGGSPEATALLVKLSRGRDQARARAAVRALADIPGAVARQAVRVALDRPKLAVSAMRSMARARDTVAFERAEAILREPVDTQALPLRIAALEAVVACGGRRAMPTVDALLHPSQDRRVRLAAVEAMVSLASASRVLSWSKEASIEELERAVQAVGSAQRLDLLGLVLDAGRHPDTGIRVQAAATLGRLALPSTTPALMGLLLDRSAAVGMTALEALARAGDCRSVRLLRTLSGHPGPPGAAAAAVLGSGQLLRRPAPDPAIRVVARSPEEIPSRERARIAAFFAGTGVQVSIHERGLSGGGELAPDNLAGLAALVRALSQVDELISGLRWSVRDAQGLLRRVGGRWLLSSTQGRIVRDAGWMRGELTATSRPPLSPIVRRPLIDPGQAESLPVGLADLPPIDEDDEDVDDEATEQTISDFLEEATGMSPGDDIPGTSSVDGFEEHLFDIAPPPRRSR